MTTAAGRSAHRRSGAADSREMDVAAEPRECGAPVLDDVAADRRAAARRLLGGRRALVAAIVLGIVLRLLAAMVIGQGGEIHEFGVIGEKRVTGRGF